MKSRNKPVRSKPTQKRKYLQEWKQLTVAPNLHEALVDHFAYLADTAGYDKVLKSVMAHATRVQVREGNLEVVLSNETLIATPPLNKIPKHYPKSLVKILKQHATITFLCTLGEHKGFAAEKWFDEPENLNDETQPFVAAKKLVSPMKEGNGDFWIYHPKKRLEPREPVICYLEHEGGEIEYEERCKAGSVFLRNCARILRLNPDSFLSGSGTANEQRWWNSLDDAWKDYFKKASKNSRQDATYIRELMNSKYLALPNDSTISTLEPIRAMKSLTEICILTPASFDFSPFLALRHVKKLILSGSSISSISVLKNMTRLEELHL